MYYIKTKAWSLRRVEALKISARLSSTTTELEIIDQKSSRALKRLDQPGRRNLIIEAICYRGFKSKFNGLPFFQKKKNLGLEIIGHSLARFASI